MKGWRLPARLWHSGILSAIGIHVSERPYGPRELIGHASHRQGWEFQVVTQDPRRMHMVECEHTLLPKLFQRSNALEASLGTAIGLASSWIEGVVSSNTNLSIRNLGFISDGRAVGVPAIPVYRTSRDLICFR
jgi:hypothetical protein